MTQEEKQLLLKDLCARLPYNVIINCTEEDDEKTNFNCFLASDMIKDIKSETAYWIIKPYLRSMSSMTEQEKDELYTAMDWYGEIDESGNVYTKGQEKVYRETFYEYTDWLNEHHFDYRGLIPMGLALKAPEGMYK